MKHKPAHDLTPAQRAALAALWAEAGLVAPTEPALSRRPEGPPPLSFAQERLWYLYQLLPGQAAYNIPVSIQLKGALNAARLGASLNDVVARHETLRTTFSGDRQRPGQTVHDNLTVELPISDLQGTAPAAQASALAHLEADMAEGPIDIVAGPLLRARLVRLAPTEHVFLLTIHHIVADGWSLAVLFRELSEAYTALGAGHAPAFAPLPRQYADYAGWERMRVQSEGVKKQQSYWTKQLSGGQPLTTLPSANDRPEEPAFRGRWLSRLLPLTLAAELKGLARREGVTFLVTLLAAFNVLLHRYTGATDIMVGSPVTNRRRRELEGLIGHFVNVQVLRTNLSGRPTFVDFLQRQRQVVLDAIGNQEVPFEFLLENLAVARSFNKHPLIQTTFILQDVPADADWRTALRLPGVSAEQRFVHSQTAKYDLTVIVEALPAGLTVSVEYDTALFDAPAMEQLLAHYEQLLQSIVTDPDRPVGRLSLISPLEIDEIRRWNQTQSTYPHDRAIHELFAEQARRRPEAVAIKYSDRTLTYGALEKEANQLAHHLRHLGVRRHDNVAIFTERSSNLIVGILGILKAGAGYVPLDPQFPTARLHAMLAAAGANVLLAHAGVPEAFRASVTHVVPLEVQRAAYSVTAPAIPGDGLDPAYVMFTSGSTGRPKGIIIPHRGIARLVLNTNYGQIVPGDRIGQASNASFDAATYEIWGALLNGACLVGVPKETLLAPRQLATFLRQEGIHNLFLTTSLFNQIVQMAPDALRSVRDLMIGGETVDPRWVKVALDQQAPQPQSMFNCYGPTESATFATVYSIDTIPANAKNVPIGYPVANTTAYILDPELTLLPPGIPGELCLGGDGLALGYLDQPALTAAAFVPDPFAESPGQRLYRTGDRAQFRHDGAIEYLGRIDNMVKIRGFRIEPGEIQVVLLRHAAVRDAVVTVREDEKGEKYLAAYATLESGASVDSDALRRHIATVLPDYMVPGQLLILAAMPLNANGKIDHGRLPAVTRGPRTPTVDFEQPGTERERQVAEIWADVLALPAVGLHDNFFDLGGHSLHLIQVHARLEALFQKTISMVTLFAYPTVSAVAAQLGAETENDEPAGSEDTGTPGADAGADRGAKRRARTRRRRGGPENRH